MARRRYFFSFDSTNPLAWVDRYLASSSLDQRASGVAAAFLRGPDVMRAENQTNARIRESIRQQAALTERLSRSDLFAPTAWAVDSAALLEANPGALSPRMRAFFDAPHRSTQQVVLCIDRDAALSALAAARSRSMETIAAMPPAPQSEAVRAMIDNFAAYFSALGVRVSGWARWRDAWTRATGCPSIGDGLQPFLMSELSASLPQGYELLFRSRPGGGPASAASVDRYVALLSRPRPSPPWSQAMLDTMQREHGTTFPPNADSPFATNLAANIARSEAYREASSLDRRWPTPWFKQAAERYRIVMYGADVPSNRRFDPSMVFFGSSRQVASYSGTEWHESSVGGLAGGARSVFRYTINDANEVVDAYSNAALAMYGVSSARELFSREDCVARDGSDGLPAAQAGFNWYCGYIASDAQNRCFYMEPSFWYAQLLWPLLNYLSTRDPLEIVYEVMLDVAGKNLWTTIATGRNEATLASLSASAPLRSAQDAAERFARTQQGFQTAAASAATIAGFINPVFGALVGLGMAAIAGAQTGLRGADVRPAMDCLGRYEPVIESLQVREGGTRAWQCSESDPAVPAVVTYHGRDVEPSQATPGFALLAPVGSSVLSAARRPRVPVLASLDGAATFYGGPATPAPAPLAVNDAARDASRGGGGSLAAKAAAVAVVGATVVGVALWARSRSRKRNGRRRAAARRRIGR